MYGIIVLLYQDLIKETNPEKIEKIILESKLDKNPEFTNVLFVKAYSIKLRESHTTLCAIQIEEKNV